jgi:hypothetical protein
MAEVANELDLVRSMQSPFVCNGHFAFQDKCLLYLVLDLAMSVDLRVNIGIMKTKKQHFTAEQTKCVRAKKRPGEARAREGLGRAGCRRGSRAKRRARPTFAVGRRKIPSGASEACTTEEGPSSAAGVGGGASEASTTEECPSAAGAGCGASEASAKKVCAFCGSGTLARRAQRKCAPSAQHARSASAKKVCAFCGSSTLAQRKCALSAAVARSLGERNKGGVSFCGRNRLAQQRSALLRRKRALWLGCCRGETPRTPPTPSLRSVAPRARLYTGAPN